MKDYYMQELLNSFFYNNSEMAQKRLRVYCKQ